MYICKDLPFIPKYGVKNSQSPPNDFDSTEVVVFCIIIMFCGGSIITVNTYNP